MLRCCRVLREFVKIYWVRSQDLGEGANALMYEARSLAITPLTGRKQRIGIPIHAILSQNNPRIVNIGIIRSNACVNHAPQRLRSLSKLLPHRHNRLDCRCCRAHSNIFPAPNQLNRSRTHPNRLALTLQTFSNTFQPVNQSHTHRLSTDCLCLLIPQTCRQVFQTRNQIYLDSLAIL